DVLQITGSNIIPASQSGGNRCQITYGSIENLTIYSENPNNGHVEVTALVTSLTLALDVPPSEFVDIGDPANPTLDPIQGSVNVSGGQITLFDTNTAANTNFTFNGGFGDIIQRNGRTVLSDISNRSNGGLVNVMIGTGHNQINYKGNFQ